MRFAVTCAVTLTLLTGPAVRAADPPAPLPTNRVLVVGTKHAPPFAIKHADGTWHGVSIDLWRELAADLDLRYELREFDLQGLLKGVQDGSLDAAVAALTVTAQREVAMDFTHPLHTTGLGIAVISGRRAGWLALIERVLSREFLTVVAALAVVLAAVGLLVWLFERRRNAAEFGGLVRGVGAGFWWSAVTMTTVGYGDKVPVTLGGRLVALVWMFAALVVIATFTGAIASALTVGQLEGAVAGPRDLPNVSVGTVAGSTSESYLQGHRIAYEAYPSAADGLRGVADREIDAFVYDAPLLRYLVNAERPAGVVVLPVTFQRQDYAIALPAGSPLREPINRALLKVIGGPGWQDTLYHYLGK